MCEKYKEFHISWRNSDAHGGNGDLIQKDLFQDY